MRSPRLLTAYALLSIGALWLLIEIGFVPTSLTLALLDWWPLLLVALGLDVLIPAGRRGPVPITVYAAVAILVIGALGLSGRAAPEGQDLQQALTPETRSLTAHLQPGSARALLRPAQPGELVSVAFEGTPAGEARLEGTAEPKLVVSRGRGRIFGFGRSTWNVALSTEVPLDLEVDAGSGGIDADLTGFDLSALEVDGGSGSVHLQLPGGGRFFRAELEGGSGAMRLGIAPGASLDMEVSSGSGGVQIEVGEGTDLDLTLASRSGAVVLDLPDDSPIRLEITDDGSGRLQLPDYLTRRSGSGDTGVWQSAAFERGGRVILVRIVDVGSGSITVR